MLKYASKTVAIPLTKLFNLSLKQCRYPSLWKIAHFMSLFKKDDKSNVSNYRPVSLISSLGKYFEMVVNKHFIQSYSKKFSFIHISIRFYSWALNSTSSYRSGAPDIYSFRKLRNNHIYCDKSKAFDRFWHVF